MPHLTKKVLFALKNTPEHTKAKHTTSKHNPSKHKKSKHRPSPARQQVNHIAAQTIINIPTATYPEKETYPTSRQAASCRQALPQPAIHRHTSTTATQRQTATLPPWQCTPSTTGRQSHGTAAPYSKLYLHKKNERPGYVFLGRK